ncbi:hypothetical protein D3C78_661130 [compost metagenome]
MAGLRHHDRTRIGLIVGLFGHVGGEGRIAGDLADGGAHLVDGGGDLDGAIPLGGTVVLGQLGLGGHLVGGGGELAGVARHLLDGAVDLGDEVVEAGGDLAQFVPSFHLEALGQIPVTTAQFPEQASQFVEGATDGAGQQHAEQPHADGDEQAHQHYVQPRLVQLGIDLGFRHLGHQIPVEQGNIAGGEHHGLAIYFGVGGGKGLLGHQRAGARACQLTQAVSVDTGGVRVQLHLAAAIRHEDEAAVADAEVGEHADHAVEGLGEPGQAAPVELLEVDEQLHLAIALAKDAEHQILAALGVVVEPVVLLMVQDAQEAVLVVVGGALAIGEGGGDQAILARHVLELVDEDGLLLLGHAAGHPVQHEAVIGQLSGGARDRGEILLDLLADALGQVGQLLLEHAGLDQLLGRALAEVAHQQAGESHGEDDGGQNFLFECQACEHKGDSGVWA